MATLVEGDPKAPFSIAITLRCRGGRYSILRIAPLYPWSSPYSAECLARQHQVFGMTWPGIEPWFPWPLVNTLYLSKRPNNARIWHKAVFKVGPVAGPKPTRVRQGQKYLFGVPQAPGNKPPPEGGISLGGWPPEARGNLQCQGTPGRTAQRLDSLLNATQELERKGHTQTP